MAYILISEISKKQDYIFKSNKLAENIGASFIVKHITEELPNEYLTKCNGKEIYEGGGKSLYIFNSENEAKLYTKEFSRTVLENFPGIELFMTGSNFNYDEDDVIEVIDKVYKKLARKKSQRRRNVGIVGYGINKLCYSTNLPAYRYYKNGKREIPISREISVKIENSSKAHEYFKNICVEGYEFPKDFDSLGRSNNEKSYIAVVHIDGNKMGKKVENFKERNKRIASESIKNHNDNYIIKINKFSNEIKSAYEFAFKEMNKQIVKNFALIKDKLSIDDISLPIRPLILAGDDVCFVCDGRIGIECAKFFIEKLNNYDFDGGVLHACAGVAIVKAHYPFSKAYELAEQLCANAKNDIDGEDASLIDWHISQGEISESIYSIREKYYYSENDRECKLNMRPLYIDSNRSWRNYNNFRKAINDISRKEVSRSKIKELREIIREGKKKTELYVNTNGLENVIHRLPNVSGSYGFTNDNVSMYYDAIETIDFYSNIMEAEK